MQTSRVRTTGAAKTTHGENANVLKISFTLNMDKTRKALATQAFADASSLIDDANGAYSSAHHARWLGNGISDLDVKTLTGRLASFVDTVDVTLGQGSAEGAGASSFAFCNAEKWRGKRTYAEDYAATWGKSCTVILGSNFFSDKVSRGERAHSLLHEFTHLAFATTDEKFAKGPRSGENCYGGDYCVDFARDEPGQACMNAENWGFYLTAYRGALGYTEEDARYLEPEDCASIRGKRFG